MMTGKEVARARELLGWSITKLADEAALAKKTLELFERGESHLTAIHTDVLRAVLNEAGVEFDQPGVRLRAGMANPPRRGKSTARDLSGVRRSG